MRFTNILAITAMTLAGTGAVLADGMPRGKESVAPAPVAEAPARDSRLGGCYVRADVGYGWSASDHATATISPIGANGSGTGRVQQSSFDDSWFGEVGVGCSLMRQSMVGGSIKDAPHAVSSPSGLRVDVTFGFGAERDFKGIPVSPPPFPAQPPVYDPVHAKVRANTLMFNAYYDLNSIGPITPYVGAGIGFGFVDLRGVTFPNGAVITTPDNDATNLAWSLMAGLATDIGRGMKLDIGYRYLNLGDISARNPGAGYSLKLNDVSEHQFKVGIRVPVSF